MAFLKFTLNEVALLMHVNRLQGDMPFVRQDLLLQRHSDGAPGSGGGHERPACDELVFSLGGCCTCGREDSPWETDQA